MQPTAGLRLALIQEQSGEPLGLSQQGLQFLISTGNIWAVCTVLQFGYYFDSQITRKILLSTTLLLAFKKSSKTSLLIENYCSQMGGNMPHSILLS